MEAWGPRELLPSERREPARPRACAHFLCCSTFGASWLSMAPLSPTLLPPTERVGQRSRELPGGLASESSRTVGGFPQRLRSSQAHDRLADTGCSDKAIYRRLNGASVSRRPGNT